jgi:succinate-acetate transporter protein
MPPTNVATDHDIVVENSRDPMAGQTALARETVSALSGSIADPGPLGLAAFALTTFVLSAVNAGWVSKGTEPVVLGLALAYGGFAQILAGMWEFKKGNTFGATAFTSYGAFWVSFWAFVVFYAAKVPKADTAHAVGIFLFAWGIFTLYMLVASLKTTGAIATVFTLLTVTFFLLALGEWGGNESLVKLGGLLGIVTALAAWYASMAGVVNSTFGKTILPTKPLKA